MNKPYNKTLKWTQKARSFSVHLAWRYMSQGVTSV